MPGGRNNDEAQPPVQQAVSSVLSQAPQGPLEPPISLHHHYHHQHTPAHHFALSPKKNFHHGTHPPSAIYRKMTGHQHHKHPGYTQSDPAPVIQPKASATATPIEISRQGVPDTATATLNMSKVADFVAARHKKHQETTGSCLHGVLSMLAAGGVHVDTSGMPRHKDRETGELTIFAHEIGKPLKKAGFTDMGKIPLDQVSVGSVVVWGAAGPAMADGEREHRAGHVDMRVASSPNGPKSWVSDNIQDYKNPYGQNNYTVYSPAKVAFNDAPAVKQHYAGRTKPPGLSHNA